MPPLPAVPPSPDAMISQMAQNLGVPPERLRAALEQVEGPNHFFFTIPVPAPGRP